MDMVQKLLLDQSCDTALSISSCQARVGPPWWVCGAFWGDIGALASLPRVAWVKSFPCMLRQLRVTLVMWEQVQHAAHGFGPLRTI